MYDTLLISYEYSKETSAMYAQQYEIIAKKNSQLEDDIDKLTKEIDMYKFDYDNAVQLYNDLNATLIYERNHRQHCIIQ
jgi:flagellar capping protein FliD